MEFAFVPDRAAREALAAGVEDVVSAEQKGIAMYTEQDAVDALLTELDREHGTEQLAEQVEELLDEADGARWRDRPFGAQADQLSRSAEVDQLLQDVERKLVAAHKIATGQQQYGTARRQARVQQARRRSDKVALRRLPTRASDFADLDGEAA